MHSKIFLRYFCFVMKTTSYRSRLFCHIFVGFFVTFLSLAKFRLGRGLGPLPPPGFANAPIEKNKKGVRKISARLLVFSKKISTVKKIVLSSSRGQGNFRGQKASRPRPRTGGFEAKAKDLKMCS